MDYGSLKQLHALLALISISGFLLRATGRWLDWGWMARRAVRIVPHVIDTALLATGIWLWIMVGWGAADWLLFKMVMLLVYILSGVAVLRPATPRRFRLAATLLALISISCLVYAAFQKQIPVLTL